MDEIEERTSLVVEDPCWENEDVSAILFCHPDHDDGDDPGVALCCYRDDDASNDCDLGHPDFRRYSVVGNPSVLEVRERKKAVRSLE